MEGLGQDQRHVSAGGISRQDHIVCAVAQVHQIVPGGHGVLLGGGPGVLGGQAVGEGQHLAAGDAGHFGRQHPGIAQISGGVAAAVAVEDDPAGIVAPLGPYPGHGQTVQVKRLPGKAQGRRYHLAQDILVPALALQQLRLDLTGMAGVVDHFEDRHHGVRQFLIDGGGESFVLFHVAPFTFCRPGLFLFYYNMFFAGCQLAGQRNPGKGKPQAATPLKENAPTGGISEKNRPGWLGNRKNRPFPP